MTTSPAKSSFRLVLAPNHHTVRDLKERIESPCCTFYLRVGAVFFPERGWVDVLPAVAGLLLNTTGLFGSVVEYEAPFFRGPFRLRVRVDRGRCRELSAYDNRTVVHLTCTVNGRPVRGGRHSLSLRSYARYLLAKTDGFLSKSDPRKRHRAFDELRAAFDELKDAADPHLD